MTEVKSIKGKEVKYLTPQDLLNSATEEGQNKVIIASLSDDGKVKVYSSDMEPVELLYLSQSVDMLCGCGALQGQNTRRFDEDFDI